MRRSGSYSNRSDAGAQVRVLASELAQAGRRWEGGRLRMGPATGSSFRRRAEATLSLVRDARGVEDAPGRANETACVCGVDSIVAGLLQP